MELNKSIFKSLIVIIIILIVLLFGTNIAWFVYESQWQEVTTTTTEQYIDGIENVANSNFSQIIN